MKSEILGDILDLVLARQKIVDIPFGRHFTGSLLGICDDLEAAVTLRVRMVLVDEYNIPTLGTGGIVSMIRSRLQFLAEQGELDVTKLEEIFARTQPES